MDAIRNIRRKLEDYSKVPAESDDELDLSMQSAEKNASYYDDSRSSVDTQRAPVRSNARPFPPRKSSNNRGLKLTTLVLALALIVLSTFHAILLLNPPRPEYYCSPPPQDASITRQQRISDCGSSVAEAKAKGCSWDELTKAYLPAECPRFGIDEYRLEGIVNNPRDNASSWAYYTDPTGAVEVNFNGLAEVEDRNPNTTSYTTTRQHLVHCAWSLKRVIWSYGNGYGVYEKVSDMHHVNHCINQLFRRAIRKDDNDDSNAIIAEPFKLVGENMYPGYEKPQFKNQWT